MRIRIVAKSGNVYEGEPAGRVQLEEFGIWALIQDDGAKVRVEGTAYLATDSAEDQERT